MNKHLQRLLQIIQEDESLTGEKKNAALKSLQDAEKEFEVAAFKLDRTEKVKRTTSVLLEETIIELEQKRKTVAEQNRELEIESSLESVRTVAMGMNRPEDMLQVCKTIALQLALLGVKDIRNVQTAIFYEARGTYMNYEYYERHQKTVVTETDYTNHKIAKAFASKMLKGQGQFYTTHIKGKKVKEWLAYQKTTNVFIDHYLAKADSLSYYWHSLGPVALGISTYAPLTKEETELFNRFLNVFELAYRRFLDIEKAMAQAKEAKMEASLEKVRAVAMSMNKPDDLLNICEILYKEFNALGFADLRNAMINIHNDEKKTFVNYDYSDEIGKSTNHLEYAIHPVIEKQIRQIRSGNDAFSETVFAGKDLTSWKKFRKKIGETDDPRINKATALYYYFYSIGTGSIGISTFSPAGEEKLTLLRRFRNVFNLSYQRYLDIALAEAQAKEARVQAALERVRASAMAMHKSEDLLDVCEMIYNEFRSLGFSEIRNTIINIHNNADHSFLNYDYAPAVGKNVHLFTNNVLPFVGKIIKASQRAEDAFSESYITGKALAEFIKLRKQTGQADDKRLSNAKSLHFYFYSIGVGSIGISTFSPVGEEKLKLLKRFRNVFNLSYQRYQDIALAEAQAKEARIEAALERVRAQAMSMRKSEELAGVGEIIFAELKTLGFSRLRNTEIVINNDAKDTVISYYYSDYGVTGVVEVLYKNNPLVKTWIETMKTAGNGFAKMEIPEKEMKAWRKYREEVGHIPDPKLNKAKTVFYYSYSIGLGALSVSTWATINEEQLKTLERFRNVFGLAYRRYVDVAQAEAQAREAQIELALERVRARTMAMQKSEELQEIIRVVFEQFLRLNILVDHAGFIMDYKVREDMDIWLADKRAIPSRATIPYFDTPHWNSFREAKEKGIDFFANRLDLEEKNRFYQTLFKLFPIPAEAKEYYFSCPGLAISTVLLENVGLYIENFSAIPYSDEENGTLMRFGKVFQQTYTRFLDLQKAEAQALESKIEAALERVRSRTLAMQKSSELAETAAVLFRQLIALGIAPNRLYIGIIKDDMSHIEFWVTDEDGSKVSTQFRGDINRNASMKKMYDAWRAQQTSITIDMQGQELADYFHYLNVELKVPFKQGLSQKRRIQSIAVFGKGFLGIASPDEQPEATMTLLERFASVFNLTYARFNDLQIAEHHAQQAALDLIQLKEEKKRTEEALTELKATQTQLIQSEKMASLGELTAGIAHEIQNPLNFVNNFSEVNAELIGELEQEILKGNFEEVKLLAKDIKDNEQKINHHGKRAGDIVKGMLQHSRSSSGVKEPTDINALADEYLRLAYHGLRAKDKSFNAKFATNLDESIGKVNLIPQDVGRVVLNLITNAFYAVSERKGLNQPGYEPTVVVSTKNLGDRVLISVRDNGTGISQKVVDKIFQPFFTTKPTGQGTGLGLSLSYDIVKAHGGELKVETKVGEGSEFVFQLPAV